MKLSTAWIAGTTVLTGGSLLLLAARSSATEGNNNIQGVDFVFNDKTQQWDCTLPASQLPLLGVDLREDEERFPPSPPAAADQLFRTSHKFASPEERELFLPALCRRDRGPDAKITDLCANNPASANKVCGYCQNSIDVELESTESGSVLCTVYTSCANRTDTICMDAPAQCFETACPTARRPLDALPAGMCTDSRFTYKACKDPRFCYNADDGDTTWQLCDGSSRRLLEVVPDMDETSQRTFVGFVRVPKTGSTTLLKFLDVSHQMVPWGMFLSSEEAEMAEAIRRGDNSKTTRTSTTTSGTSTSSKSTIGGAESRSGGSCVFGPARSMDEIGGTEKNEAAAPWWNSCPHVTFGSLVASWTKTLPSYQRPDDEMTSVSLNAITMVRDPFDRLVSYFYYLRKFSYTNNFLMNTVTKTQYQFVEDNDLEGWLRQLHLENGGRGLNLPYQYKYVHQDVNEAIRLIQNDGVPEVYTLLTECYEVSLRLLAQNFVGFQEEIVDAFLESDQFESNHNKALYSEKPDKATLAMIRSKAEVWFADDFTFYDAAVEQFVAKMAASGLSDRQLETCRYWSSGKHEVAEE